MSLRVVHPGQFSTVQDLGRHGFAHLGVTPGGAADTLSLRIGNRLLGNHDNAAAVEMTFVGATLETETDITLVLTGARAAAIITQPSGVLSEVSFWTPFTLRTGERLRIAAIQHGCRAYLCAHGGFDVPVVLCGRGTHLAAAFGGHEGRLLRAGDVLPTGPGNGDSPRTLTTQHAARVREWFRPTEILVTRGPHAADFDRLFNTEFRVDPHTDRTGIRLAGQGPTGHALADSEPTAPGFIEATPSGHPIILGPDAPTTGGYPVVACVAGVHLPLLGQLRPGDAVRFREIDIDRARGLFLEREIELDAMIPPVPEPHE